MISERMTTKRAPFIVIEGLDRSGKTTQTLRLQERLKSEGYDTTLMKFPDRTTPIGKIIDSYLRSDSELDDRAVHLLFSANRWELAPTIEKHLASGTSVICDRYAFSGIAFSASKVTTSGGDPLLPFEWCRSPDVGLPAPDLVIFFNVSPEKAKERGGFGEERYENEEMQRRVRDNFKRIGSEMVDAMKHKGGRTHWVSIDAGRERYEVAEEVWNLVEPYYADGQLPVSKLWT